jgi:hypothetical protein
MTATSPKCERRQHRNHFGPDVVRCDQELRLEWERVKGSVRRAGKPIAAKPPLVRAASVFFDHGSLLPGDQGKKAFRWYQSAATHPDSAQAPG